MCKYGGECVSIENTTNDGDENVIVIEEKAKSNHWVAGVTLIIGIVIGGLVGSALSENKWAETYAELTTKSEEKDKLYQEQLDKNKLIESSQAASNADEIKLALEEQEKTHNQEKEQLLSFESDKRAPLNERIKLLASQNTSLEMQVKEQDEQIVKLINQVELQLTMLSRSKQLFQRQMLLKEEQNTLQTKLNAAVENEQQLAKNCALYQEGKSWDAKSDACKRQEQANKQVSQYNEQLQQLRMDIREIDYINEDLGM